MVPPESLPLTVNFDDLKEPDNPFWVKLDGPNSDRIQTSIPFNLKRKAMNTCHLLERTKEEQTLLKEEMCNTFTHFQQQHDLITEFLLAAGEDIVYDEIQLGELLFCQRKLLYIESRLLKIHQVFSPYISIDTPHLFLLTEEQPESQRDILEEDEEETVIVNTLTEEFDSVDEYDSDDDMAIDEILQ